MSRDGDPGPGVDAYDRPVVDPTENVLNLVEAAIQRQDDLRLAELAAMRGEVLAMRREIELRAEFYQQLREQEAERINAIRAVDVGAVQRAAEVQALQAETLRSQVATSAEALRVAWASSLEPIQKDIADLRKTQYEQAGQRAQVGESRLNVGAIFGALALLVSVIGVVALLMRSGQ